MTNTELQLGAGILALGKVELQTFGEAEAKRLLEEGFVDASKLMVDSKKYLEILTAFNKAVKTAAIDELTANSAGVTVGNAKVVLSNLGDTLDYAEDPIYIELKAKVDARIALLKTAIKQDDPIYDSMGIQVPKVRVKTVGGTTIRITL